VLYYLVKRLGLSAMVIGLVVLVLFSLLHLIPGDPATIALGPRATPEAIARYAAKMHLDEPVWRQFLIYIGNAATGDLGLDVFSDRPVTAIIMERIGFTLALVCAGMGWAMVLGYSILAVPTGIVTAEIVEEAATRHRAITTRVCVHCMSEGHEPSARFCKDCGAALERYESQGV